MSREIEKMWSHGSSPSSKPLSLTNLLGSFDYMYYHMEKDVLTFEDNIAKAIRI